MCFVIVFKVNAVILLYWNFIMDFSSNEELLVIASIAEEEEKRKKRLWVHNINTKRDKHTDFFTLFPDFLEHESKLFKYLDEFATIF